MNVTIIGAGIAGLTAAIGLKRLGIEAKVFEAAPHLEPVGAGLGLAANAIKALRKLGIADKIIPLGCQLPSFKILNREGKVITQTNSLSVSDRFGLDNFTIHRADLHQALLQEINPESVLVNKRATGLQKSNGIITINFADGTCHETDYFLIADGINSELRKSVAPEANMRYAGYTCWRGVIDTPDITLHGATETWAPEGRFGVVPVAGNRIYWYACINAKPAEARFKAFTAQDLSNYFRDFHSPVQEIISRTKQLLQHDIYDLQPLKKYAYGNILLLGDAAHATTPNLGQGACQAIEDAAVLMAELAKNPFVTDAFAAFEKRRIARTHFVINQSRTLGKVAQLQNPVLCKLRDVAFRFIPDFVQEKQFEKLYNADLS